MSISYWVIFFFVILQKNGHKTYNNVSLFIKYD